MPCASSGLACENNLTWPLLLAPFIAFIGPFIPFYHEIIDADPFDFQVSRMRFDNNYGHYYRSAVVSVMIRSFADKLTAAVFAGYRVNAFSPHVQDAARRKLKAIDAAKVIDDLRVPPGNRLEKLSGDRKGQWSIRINDQWRVCFRWENGDAQHVRIMDYH